MKIEIKLNQEQFDLLLNSLVQVAQGVHKLSDSWEGKGKETDIIGDIFTKDLDVKEEKKDGRRRYNKRHTEDIGARTIMYGLGLRLNKNLFRAACLSVNVKPFKHYNDHHLYIHKEDAAMVTNALKKLAS